MKIKKRYVAGIIVMLVIAKSSYIIQSLCEMVGKYVTRGDLAYYPMMLISDLLLGAINLISQILAFILSWQGVLLLFVVLLYRVGIKYCEKNSTKLE